MKKAIIAAGASAVLAAMPVVGVFAANSNTVTDTLVYTLSESCSLSATAAANGTKTTDGNNITVTYEKTIANSASDTLTGSTINAVCNDNGNWYITAVSGTNDNDATTPLATMVGSDDDNEDYLIKSGTYASDAATSYWGFKLDASTNSYEGAVSGSYGTAYQAIPVVATTVATGNKTDAGAGVAGVNFTPTYYVRMSATQSADTYTGSVIYQMTHPAA